MFDMVNANLSEPIPWISSSNQTYQAVESIVERQSRSVGEASPFPSNLTSKLSTGAISDKYSMTPVILDQLNTLTTFLLTNNNSSIGDSVPSTTFPPTSSIRSPRLKSENRSSKQIYLIFKYGHIVSLTFLILSVVVMVCLAVRFRPLRSTRNYIHGNLLLAFIFYIISWLFVDPSIQNYHSWNVMGKRIKINIDNFTFHINDMLSSSNNNNTNQTFIQPQQQPNYMGTTTAISPTPPTPLLYSKLDTVNLQQSLLISSYDAKNFTETQRTSPPILNLEFLELLISTGNQEIQNLASRLKLYRFKYQKLMKQQKMRIVLTLTLFSFYYFNTASYFWMLCEGIYLFQLIFHGFENRVYPFKVYLVIGWVLAAGAVFAVFLILLFTNQNYLDYSIPNGVNAFAWCWLIPVGLNLIVFLSVMSVVLRKCCSPIHGKENRCKGIFFLIPLLGLMHIIMMYSQKNFITTVIGPILKSLQGVFISFYCCFLNAEIKEAVTTLYNIWRIGKSHRSSSNNSALLTPLSSISIVKDHSNATLGLLNLSRRKSSADTGTEGEVGLNSIRNNILLKHLQLLRKQSRDSQGVESFIDPNKPDHRLLSRARSWFQSIISNGVRKKSSIYFSILKPPHHVESEDQTC